MKRIIIFSVVAVIVLAVLYGVKEYFRTNADLSDEKPVATLSAQQLIKAFETDSIGSNNRYVNQVLAVTGTVTAVQASENPVVITLGEEGIMSSVQCSMDSTHAGEYSRLVAGKRVAVKGICTGALQEEIFGTDVKLNRCVLVDDAQH